MVKTRVTIAKLPECRSLPDVDYEHRQSQVKSAAARNTFGDKRRLRTDRFCLCNNLENLPVAQL